MSMEQTISALADISERLKEISRHEDERDFLIDYLTRDCLDCPCSNKCKAPVGALVDCYDIVEKWLIDQMEKMEKRRE